MTVLMQGASVLIFLGFLEAELGLTELSKPGSPRDVPLADTCSSCWHRRYELGSKISTMALTLNPLLGSL